MALTEKDVLHVAKLSALEVAPQDIPGLQKNLNDILEYVERLSAVPTTGIEPTSHVHGVVNAFRDDIIKDSLAVDEVASGAPDFIAGSFRVPKII